jgi:hypothetical protein
MYDKFVQFQYVKFVGLYLGSADRLHHSCRGPRVQEYDDRAPLRKVPLAKRARKCLGVRTKLGKRVTHRGAIGPRQIYRQKRNRNPKKVHLSIVDRQLGRGLIYAGLQWWVVVVSQSGQKKVLPLDFRHPELL